MISSRLRPLRQPTERTTGLQTGLQTPGRCPDDYRGSRRDCDSQPALIRRELRSGALIAAERVELRPRVGSGSSVAAARFHEEGPFEVRARTSHAEFENASVSSDRRAQEERKATRWAAQL
jgi:hypothetical protein